MLEEMCRDVFRRACQEVMDAHETHVWLKGKSKPVNEFGEYITWPDRFQTWDGWLVKRVTNAKRDDPIRDAFNYFVHGEKIRDAYIRKKYGTLENAMRQTGTFSVLFNGFLEDFSERRDRFLDEMEQLIESARQTALSQKRTKGMPQSHGGVANLLKVLTQTMKAQGSSIKTIARVQYAVCIQAGILIPGEFLTDVLVAANIEKDGAQ